MMDSQYVKKVAWISAFLIGLSFLIFYFLLFTRFPAKKSDVVKLYFVDNISDTHQFLIDKFNREFQGKIHVEAVNLPFSKFSTNERKEILARSLRSKSERIDVFTVDIIWTPRFAKWGASLAPYYTAAELEKFIPQALKTCYYKKRLITVPFYLDVGLLYFEEEAIRSLPDSETLLKQIEQGLTWAQFITIGKRFQPTKRPIFLFSANNFEGLMCVFYELLSPRDIREMFSDTQVRLNTPAAKRALKLLYDFIYTYHFTPPAVCDFDEIGCYNMMLEDNGIFLRGWPGFWLRVDQYNQTHTQKRKIGIAPIPHFKGQRKSAVYGGWHFMVANKSKHKREAVQLIKFFQRPDNQKILFTRGGYLPALKTVYDDSSLQRSHPEISSLRRLMENGQFRPIREDYTRISDVISFYLNKALKGEIPVNEALRKAETAINSHRIILK